jgi:WD40 repeat protein
VITLTDTDRHHGVPAEVSQIAIQPGNGDLTAASYNKAVIYRLSDRNAEPTVVPIPKHRLGAKRIESLSPNGLRYAFTDDQTRRISLLDLSFSPAPMVPIEGNHDDVIWLSFDPDGDFLACADKSEIIPASQLRRRNMIAKYQCGMCMTLYSKEP